MATRSNKRTAAAATSRATDNQTHTNIATEMTENTNNEPLNDTQNHDESSDKKPKEDGNKKKPKTNPTPKYWVLRMDTGKEDLFDNLEDVADMEENLGPIIKQKFAFETKDEAEQHMKATKTANEQLNETPKKTDRVSNTESLTPDEQIRVAKVRELLEQTKPSNRIEVLFKTTNRSEKCVGIVNFLNMYGQHQWYMKPDCFARGIAAYVQEFKQSDPLIQEALLSLKWARKRDLSKGQDEVEITKWQSPDKTKKQDYDNHIAWFTFTIPINEISDETHEYLYLIEKCQQIGTAIQVILLEPPFISIIENIINNDNIWDIMMGNKKGKGIIYRHYVQDCKVISNNMENINTYIVLRDAKDLLNVLYKSRLSNKKYEPVQVRDDAGEGN